MTESAAEDFYPADSLRGQMEKLRAQMNDLVPGWGDARIGELRQDLAGKRDKVLARFWNS